MGFKTKKLKANIVQSKKMKLEVGFNFLMIMMNLSNLKVVQKEDFNWHQMMNFPILKGQWITRALLIRKASLQMVDFSFKQMMTRNQIKSQNYLSPKNPLNLAEDSNFLKTMISQFKIITIEIFLI